MIKVQGESRVIAKEAGYYHGWPSVARTTDGELLVVWSGRRHEHVCPFGVTLLVRSRDEGQTWSAPEVINNTPLDDRDAGILVLRNGSWLVTWFTSVAFADWEARCRKSYGDSEVNCWAEYARAATPALRQQWLGHWSRRSTDRGKTWEPPVRTGATAPHGPAELADGRLVYVGEWETGGREAIGVTESPDGGRSWRFGSRIPIPAGLKREWLHEPHAIQAADGRVVCLVRFTGVPEAEKAALPWKYDCMFQSDSDDGGRTWTTLHQTPLLCHPPHLIRLHNNWLLAVYGGRYVPYGERACLSRDGGRSWDVAHEMAVRDDAPNGDLGYPASVELPDGSIYTVYYQVDQPGEKACLIGTRWQLPQL